MKILLTGHKGQLGHALLPLLDNVHEVLGIDLPEYDITDRMQLYSLAQEFTPNLIINAAAMTNVDGCAHDPQLAYHANGMGPQNIALIAAQLQAEVLHISTNEVFDGTATEPYHEWCLCNPVNAYGRSKLAGEWYTRHLLKRFYIVRTAWLYAAGGRNFPHRMIELAAEHGKLRVVTDEVGNPTYVVDLAAAIVHLIDTHAYGIYHFVNAGAASRYEFAQEILKLSGRIDIPIMPITSSEFQRASTPPSYAPLENYAGCALGISLRPWQAALADFLKKTGYVK